MQILAYVACTLAPILFWFAWIRAKDCAAPEPRHLLLRCYLLGALSTLLVLALRAPLESVVMSGGHSAWRDAFLLTGPLEEVCKGLVIVLAVLHHRAFDEPLDGIVYGACAALGFATVENVLYVLQEGDPSLAAMRGFTATLAHVASTGIVGLGLALARLGHGVSRGLVIAGALLAAVLLHGAYDLGLSLQGGAARAALVTVLPGTFVALGLALRHAQRSGQLPRARRA